MAAGILGECQKGIVYSSLSFKRSFHSLTMTLLQVPTVFSHRYAPWLLSLICPCLIFIKLFLSHWKQTVSYNLILTSGPYQLSRFIFYLPIYSISLNPLLSHICHINTISLVSRHWSSHYQQYKLDYRRCYCSPHPSFIIIILNPGRNMHYVSNSLNTAPQLRNL